MAQAQPHKPKGHKGRYVYQVYEAKDGYRWRLWAPNGRIVAEGGEAYTRRATCARIGGNIVRAVDPVHAQA